MVDKVGKKTDKTTQAGRDVYITPEGESVSEKSVTLKVGDEYVNVPSIHDGIMYSEDAIYDMLVEGSIKPTSKHKTVEDAVKAAQERSDNLVFAEGGAVPMKEQMSMFEDGGLMDEGGSIDPVSGNDVPPGSTQEEVRDDIPAQLSEGEFVFPADVVRYFGLETLMKMRQEAKAGLQRMEAMGQMGNSDEATMPDDLPFDINDLDMEDDGVVEYAEGGIVQAQQGTFVQPNNSGIMGYQQSQFANSGQENTSTVQPATPFVPYQLPVQQLTPTVPVGQTPAFNSFIQPAEGMKPEARSYTNSATGDVIQITFINGQPTTPIPTGYVPSSEYVKTEPVQTEKVTAPRLRDPDFLDEGDGYQEPDNSAFGGFANSKDSDTYKQMTKELGVYQASSLSVVAAAGYTALGKATPKDISVAMYQAKVAAIDDLGIAKVSGNTIDYTDDDGNIKEASEEDLNFVAAVMNRAKAAVQKGMEAKEAAKQALEQAKADKAAKDKALAEGKDRSREARYAQESGGGDDGGSFTDDPVGTQDSSARADSYSGGSSYGDPDGRAKGGLIAKQMKRSGLASK